MQRNDEDPRRYWNTLNTLSAAEKEARELVEDVTSALAEHQTKIDALKLETKQAREAEKLANAQGLEDIVVGKGKGKEREIDTVSVSGSDVDDDDDDDGLPRNPLGDQYRHKKGALLARLRECRITLHKVLFLQGDIYHVLGSAHEAEENAAYAGAEELRRALLKSRFSSLFTVTLCLNTIFKATEKASTTAMDNIRKDTISKNLQLQHLLVKLPYCGKGGIRSSDLVRI